MSAVTHARVVEQPTRLCLRYVAECIDALLGDAARTESTYLDSFDSVLQQEVDAKQRTRVTMGLKSVHFPAVKTLDDFDFRFQPSVDQRLVREARDRPVSLADRKTSWSLARRASASRSRSAAPPSRRVTQWSSPVARPCWPRSPKLKLTGSSPIASCFTASRSY